MKEFFEGEVIADALKLGSPLVKADLLNWLADKLPGGKKKHSFDFYYTNLPLIFQQCFLCSVAVKTLNKDDMIACLPYLFGALEDRAAEVRKAAQEVTLPFMIHLGYETMARNAGKLKPVSKTLVLAHLDKVRPNLPAKPAAVPAVAPSTAIRSKGAAIQPQKESPKEEEDSGKMNVGKSRVPLKSKVSWSMLYFIDVVINISPL